MASRKFAPTPFETTTKSNRAKSPSKEDDKPKRFTPQVVETSQKSSKDHDKPKKFTPQVVETSHKSSKGGDKPKRFTPQVVETSSKSSKDKNVGKQHARFAPQPFETTHSSNRGSGMDVDGSVNPHSSENSGKKVVRKFSPELINTAQRSRRSTVVENDNTDGNVDVNSADFKTESGHLLHAREHRRHITGSKTPTGEDDAGRLPQTSRWIPPDQRRPVSPLDGTRRTTPSCLLPERQHSFRCPDLDTIESSESERSAASSRASSPGQGSPITASDSSFTEYYKHATRIRESVDENFAHYLLQLEAKKAQQRLREQALAAFPNSDFHEPVQHYVNNEDDSDGMDEIEDRPVTWEGFDEDEILERFGRNRRDSTKTPWEQLEMQRHAEKAEQERRSNQATARPGSQSSPWWSAGAGHHYEQDNEMRSMRDRARPPMLGRDLKFPRCPSPEPARFDVTQGPVALRNQILSTSQSTETQRISEGGLWQAPKKDSKKDSSPKSSASPNSKISGTGGLWGGFCVGSNEQTPLASGGLAPPSNQTGLMTPRAETPSNPFDQSFALPAVPAHVIAAHTIKTPGTPPTPPRSVKDMDMNSLDSILHQTNSVNEQIEAEFPDSFITQVYNYLSLGYPSLARPFDAELSKISRVPISELREDDTKAKATPRGYIRLGPDFEGGGGEGMAEDTCARWKALRVYVHEWARQEKNGMQSEASGGNWATVARRGSWAF